MQTLAFAIEGSRELQKCHLVTALQHPSRLRQGRLGPCQPLRLLHEYFGNHVAPRLAPANHVRGADSIAGHDPTERVARVASGGTTAGWVTRCQPTCKRRSCGARVLKERLAVRILWIIAERGAEPIDQCVNLLLERTSKLR